MKTYSRPEVGDPWHFLPTAFKVNGENAIALPFTAPASLYVTGRVVQINEDHHWFRVEYENRSGVLHECFKF